MHFSDIAKRNPCRGLARSPTPSAPSPDLRRPAFARVKTMGAHLRCEQRPWSNAAATIVRISGLCAALAACAPSALLHSDWQPDADEHTATILLIKPDVELSELTAGGLQEPEAEWTVAGLANVEQALADFMGEKEVVLIPYRSPSDLSERRSQDQLLKLHRAVGSSILEHKYDTALSLPTKKNTFDWSLGEATQQLSHAYGADYALFVFIRDSYTSPGRMVLMLAIALLYGAPISGGNQAGFASLVDLESGDIVWFNFLLRSSGDLREPAPARETIDQLLTDFPL